MNTKNMREIAILLVIVFFAMQAYSQEAITPRPSPLAVVTMKYNDDYVKITYSQPHKRGREIFGGLVPYGKVWRTGANEATEITLTSDMLVKNDTLPAGTYSIFSIPNQDVWTIIFNKNLGQWGAYNYLESADVLRVEVPASKIEDVTWEPFTMAFEQKNDKADLTLTWDQTQVAVPLTFAGH